MSFYEQNRKLQNAFYGSRKWQRCRNQYISEHPFCERCKKKGIIAAAEHVHHITELDEDNYTDPMVAFNPDNLEALCYECHREEHKPTNHGKPACDSELTFDSEGNLIKYKKESKV